MSSSVLFAQAALRGGLWRVWGRGGGECRARAGVGWARFRGLRGRWWQGGQCGGALHRNDRDTPPPQSCCRGRVVGTCPCTCPRQSQFLSSVHRTYRSEPRYVLQNCLHQRQDVQHVSQRRARRAGCRGQRGRHRDYCCGAASSGSAVNLLCDDGFCAGFAVLWIRFAGDTGTATRESSLLDTTRC